MSLLYSHLFHYRIEYVLSYLTLAVWESEQPITQEGQGKPADRVMVGVGDRMKMQNRAEEGEMHAPWEQVVVMGSPPWRTSDCELLWQSLCPSIPTESQNSDHGIHTP